MEVIINRKKWDIWAFDLESHNDDESIKNGKTSMWLGCLLNDKSTVEDENSYLYTMDEFLDRIELLSRKVNKKSSTKKTGNMMIYIYNLSFEWSFIFPELLKRGFKFGNEGKYENSVSTKSVSSV